MSSLDEVVSLAAEDGELYCRTFFPSVFRQASPDFHWQIWNDWRNPEIELSAISVFRGGAKTSLLRAFTSLCVAYGISRTIVYVGVSGTKALESAEWLRRQVEGSSDDGPLWSRTYGLVPGDHWNEERLEIKHLALGHSVNIIPVGITGGIRGLNIDGHRPDLIILDDVQSEENIGTPEQRSKLNNLVYGSVRKTLAPRTEKPNSKLVMLQTPMTFEDLIGAAERDPQWKFRRFGIYNQQGSSAWEERFPTESVKQDEAFHRARNQYSIWAREMLCVCIPDEGQYFRESDLRFYERPPEKMLIVYAIDPVPPPTERQIQAGTAKKDSECHAVIGITPAGDFYLLEYAVSKGHTPEWSLNTLFSLASKWNPLRIRIETVAYQATLKWLVEQDMIKRRRFWPLESWSDQRSKSVRIRQALSGLSAAGRLYVRRDQTEFLTQWSSYPASTAHDDIVDAVSMAVSLGQELSASTDLVDFFQPTNSLSTISEDWRSAP